MRWTARSHEHRQRAGPGLVLAVVACSAGAAGAAASVGMVGPRSGPAPPPQWQAPARDSAAAPETVPIEVAGAAQRAEQQDRPFDHAAHEAVACTRCHGTGERHGTLLVSTARDCAACHHDRTRECAACHAARALPEARAVVQELSLNVWPDARMRELPFGHVSHAPAACSECHTAAVTLAMERSCGSCHASHHGAASECAACHTPALLPVHGAEVHLSCAGAGCHAADATPPLAQSRTLCVACHPAQRDHEPAASCAACHLLRTAEVVP
jgi:hypothetical protein